MAPCFAPLSHQHLCPPTRNLLYHPCLDLNWKLSHFSPTLWSSTRCGHLVLLQDCCHMLFNGVQRQGSLSNLKELMNLAYAHDNANKSADIWESDNLASDRYQFIITNPTYNHFSICHCIFNWLLPSNANWHHLNQCFWIQCHISLYLFQCMPSKSNLPSLLTFCTCSFYSVYFLSQGLWCLSMVDSKNSNHHVSLDYDCIGHQGLVSTCINSQMRIEGMIGW
jgi:hypothetical protein